VHTDFVDRSNARVPSAPSVEAQGPPEVHNWKNGLDKAAERLADGLHTCYCIREEVVHTLVVDIGSPASHKLTAQLIVLALALEPPALEPPGLEPPGQPFVCS